jgi:hypothetical protein
MDQTAISMSRRLQRRRRRDLGSATSLADAHEGGRGCLINLSKHGFESPRGYARVGAPETFIEGRIAA